MSSSGSPGKREFEDDGVAGPSQLWGKDESCECSPWRKEGSGDLIHVYKYLKVQREQSWALLRHAKQQDQRQWAQTETQEVPSDHQETPFTVQMAKHWRRLPREVV